MGNVFFMLLLFLLPSCNMEGSLPILMDLPPETHIEEVFSETAYYTLSVFNGERVQKMHLHTGRRSAVINVHRGSTILMEVAPPEGYSPLICWYEPGMAVPVTMRYDGGALIDMLMMVAEKRPEIVRNLSLSVLERMVDDLDSVSPEKLVSLLERGALDASSDIAERRYRVELESLLKGIWVSDRTDIPSIVVRKSGAPVSLMLYPGEYRFISIERDLLLTVAVGPDGRAVSRVGLPPKWS